MVWVTLEEKISIEDVGKRTKEETEKIGYRVYQFYPLTGPIRNELSKATEKYQTLYFKFEELY